jgi:PPE-repeat protein
MLKKFLVPCFIFAASVAIGCGSSSPSTTGTAGKGGTAGTGGGTAGTGTAGTGTAGTGTAGAGTAGAGTAGAGTAGAGTAGAGTAGAGTAGAGTAGAGTAGAGTAGAAGGHDGGAGAGTAGAGVDAGVDTGGGSTVAASKLLCPAKVTAANNAIPYSAADFCMLYKDVCGTTTFTGMLTDANCIEMYNSYATKHIAGGTGLQNCVSYHLCNANAGGLTTHCPHAAAMGACAPAN